MMERHHRAAPQTASGLTGRRRFRRRTALKLLAIGSGVVALPALAACVQQPSADAPAGKPPAQPTTAPAAPATAPSATAAPAAQPTAAPASKPAATAAPAAKPAAQQVLRLSHNLPPPHFNVLKATGPVQYWLFNTVMSTLTQVDPEKGEFIPELAESWEVGPDGRSYTFKLRNNAKWHDGTPVTAKDVAFTYRMALSGATGSNKTGRLSMIKGAADFTAGKSDQVGIAVVDDHTIRFDMEFPNVLFLNETASGTAGLTILPAHVLGDVAPDALASHKYFTDDLVGSGPFKFVRYVPDQLYEVEANPDYYFGKPKLERIVFNIIKSPDTTEVAMERGEIDMPIFDGGTATTAMYKKFVADPRFTLVGTQGSTLISYAFNFRHEYLKDPRIHQAFLHALDRPKLVERFNAGNGTIYNSFMTHPWYQQPEWANLYPYDPEKAKALLKEAGWDSNREVSVNIITLANDEIRAMVAVEQQMLAEVGFKISFREMEVPVWVEKFYDSHDFEMVRVTFGVFPDPDGFLSFHLKTGSKNAMGYANPELDRKIALGQQTIDRAERVRIYREINEEMLRTLPLAPLYLQNAWWIMRKRWHVPQLAKLPAATGLSDVPVAKALLSHSDVWKYHVEEWEIREA
jgi:peptide/nickel transport system substrate-binding protein